MKSRKNLFWLTKVVLLGVLMLSCASYNIANASVLTNYLYKPFVASGDQCAAVLKSDGTLWTWWATYANPNVYNGQQGQTDGGSIGFLNGGIPAPNDEYITIPARITNFLGGASVAAGDNFFMVLKWDGTVASFGGNGSGQLGNGNTTDSSKINFVTNLNAVSYISAGAHFGMAVLSNGLVKAWGDNEVGELGTGTNVPGYMDVPTNVFGLSNIVMVAGGYIETRIIG